MTLQIIEVPSESAVTTSERIASVPYLADSDFETRNAVLKAMANQAGLRLPSTRVPEGESLLAIGEENKRAMQCEISALPDAQAGLLAFQGALKAEAPRDISVPLQAVRMNEHNGGLFGSGNENVPALAYTAQGFQQVSQFLKPSAIRNGFAENMLALPVAMRAQVFNHWAQASTRKENAYIRTYKNGERRLIRAVTSDRHSLASGDDLTVTQALQDLPKGAKVRVTREPGGARSEIEIIWPAMERQLVVGDVAYLALRITNSETKGGSLTVEPTLLRVLCYNFTTAYADGLAEEFSFRHVGDLARKLPRAIRKAQESLEPFIRAFSDAYRVALPATAPTRGEILAKVRKAFTLPESTVTLAAQVWNADGVKSAGDTLAGLANALTRASQQETLANAAHTERAAGQLIAQGWGAIA